MIYKDILLLYLLLINIFKLYHVYVYGISINFITFSYDIKDKYLDEIINDFNDYSIKNNLDIFLNKILISNSNISISAYDNDYASIIDSSLKKQSTEYDLLMLNIMFTHQYEKYAIDLKQYISPEIVQKYSSGIASKIGYYNNKLVGLPLYINLGLLYSNKKYLDRYNQTIPKTWDELIKTSLYILQKEKEKGNNDLIGYLADIPDNESAVCSTLEFMYSFRDNVNSSLPDYLSENAINSFEKMKEIKELISSDDYFNCNENILKNFLFNDMAIFGRYWNTPITNYYLSSLPGNNKGISASCIDGFNLFINKYISEEKKKAAGKVIDFLLSEEIQMKYLLKLKKYSALQEIYYNEELCQEIDCEMLNNIQYVLRPTTLIKDYNEYSIRFRNYLVKFLFGNENSKDILEKIDNIAKIHYIKYNSSLGIFILVVTVTLIISVTISFVLVLFDIMKTNDALYTKNMLLTILLGLIVIGIYGFFIIGRNSVFKCETEITCTVLGTSLVFCPIIIRELIYIPEKNKLSDYVSKHSRFCFFMLISIDFVFIILMYTQSPFKIKKVMVNEGYNYESCFVSKKLLYYVLYGIILTVKAIIYLSTAFLTFIEWNIGVIYKDIRLTSLIIYTSILLIIFLFLAKFLDLKNIYATLIVRASVNILYSYFIYLVLLWSKLFYKNSIIKGNDSEIRIIKRSSRKDCQLNNIISKDSNNNNRQSFKQKIFSFHFSSGDKLFNVNSNKESTAISSTQPEIMLYTSIIPSTQITDIMCDQE